MKRVDKSKMSSTLVYYNVVFLYRISDHVRGFCRSESRLAQDHSITILNRVALAASILNDPSEVRLGGR